MRLLIDGVEHDEVSADEAGRYAFEAVEGALDSVQVRAVAEGEAAGALEVADHDGAVYAVLSEPVSVDGPVEVDLTIEEAANAGAFAVYDSARAGLELAAAAFERSSPFPPLRYRWERGRETPWGSSYFDGDSIWLLGGPEDTDEYDVSVVLHELGHYLEWVQACTSPAEGNPHAGAETDPRLAWQEGWATFFSSAARDDGVYVDSVGGEPWYVVDLEALPRSGEYLGLAEGPLSQTLSEWLVAGTLWQMLIAGEDRLTAARRSMAVITGWFWSTPTPDRGVAGYDLVDFLDGYLCLHGGLDEEVIQRYVVEDRMFPYDLAPSCGEFRWALAVGPSLSGASRGRGKPGRPRRLWSVALPPDGVERGARVWTIAGERLREVMVRARVRQTQRSERTVR